MRVLFAIPLLLLCLFAQAETLTGRVIGITDGDTLTVLDANNQQFKIRLAGIDAPETSKSYHHPERGQAFGERSKQNLSKLAFGKMAIIDWKKKHRERLVGKVMVNGVDISLEQIKNGMAWWYEKYRKEQTSSDQQTYFDAQELARDRKVGLWRDDFPTPPWQWRAESKKK